MLSWLPPPPTSSNAFLYPSLRPLSYPDLLAALQIETKARKIRTKDKMSPFPTASVKNHLKDSALDKEAANIIEGACISQPTTPTINDCPSLFGDRIECRQSLGQMISNNRKKAV